MDEKMQKWLNRFVKRLSKLLGRDQGTCPWQGHGVGGGVPRGYKSVKGKSEAVIDEAAH